MADEVEKEVPDYAEGSEDVEGQKLHRAGRTGDEIPGSATEPAKKRTYSDTDEDVEGQVLRSRTRNS
jgi:hypothetical protein